MRLLAIVLLLMPLTAGAASAQVERDRYAQAVVGLQVTYQEWDEDRPWAKLVPKHRNAVGVLIEGSYLLTTAQMVDNATLIRLTVYGRSRALEPRIIRVDPEVNLALLAVDDPEALSDLDPVAVARRTPTAGTFRTVRWSRQQLESAASRITRFEVQRGWGGRVEYAFLYLRTDLSGGGWGEPVFDDGHLIGITVSQTGQQSRVIPAEIVSNFVDRATAEGPYVGFPALGVRWQINRDAAVAAFLGQKGETRGVLVRQVPWGTSGCGKLKPLDILLELDGQTIDAEGNYLHPYLGHLRFGHLLAERHQPGDTVSALVLRNGKEREVEMTLRTYPATLDLVPSRRDEAPPYVVVGGLVLRELDVPYLRTWGKEWADAAPISLLSRYHLNQGGQSAEKRRVVLISAVLPTAYSLGYHDMGDEVVERINGVPIGGIRDVLGALDKPIDGFHVFDMAPDSSRGQVVLDAAGLDAATSEVLESYRVPQAVRMPSAPLPPGGGTCPDDY